MLPWPLRRERERARRRGVFDPDFYLAKYPDVAAAAVDPLRHYVEHGALEGRKPHRLFDPEFYFRQRPAARQAGVEALLDFLEDGARYANPHPLFDCEGDAQRFVEHAARNRGAMHAEAAISDEPLPLQPAGAPHQRAFFEAVREDQLRAQTKPR